ncbi:zinc finger protein ZFP2 isoform X7 [Bicyclus anynana]|uniref:Zinc finger protein ZFP2 isoform X7 n=1 Tax=Bicyclus anynana TaxID=110368 RepID=A0A6J1N4D9_BICAN|nr:zinc finger protein ZFP2 isoform X7 [Bicyclus anynana]
MEGVLSDGMCRCCASEGSFKDFQVPYQWMGAEEIYANMLKDCFDLTLSISEEINNGGICEVCITQLRNACNFKRQVQKTEEKFKRKMEESSFKTDSIKMEVTRFDDDDSNMSADEFSSQEYEVPIKVEKLDEKPRKRQAAAKASTSKAKKSKASAETSVKRVVPVDITKVKKKIEPNSKEVHDAVRKQKQLNGQLLTKHWSNVREILAWSNATPIRNHSDMGYSCCYCDHVYLDPADLKQHTIDTHEGIENSSITRRRDMNAFSVKVDITDLHCKVCQQRIADIKTLMNHLKDLHDKTLFTDIKNHLIPFRFEKENLECCICPTQFNKFKILLEHMNVHVRNYVCEVCDAGFVNRTRLMVHQEQHELGKYKCDLCPGVFTTVTKVKFHIKSVHKPVTFRNKCRLCNELFKDYHQKIKHMQDVHQVRKTQKCTACDRIFSSRQTFSVHMQRDHLMERRHVCTICEKSFFQSTCLRHHMLKHTGKRDFQCDVCLKRYGRKSTLRDHMRIHKDDRRYKCEYCGHAFVQKCSWQAHMRTKHGQKF